MDTQEFQYELKPIREELRKLTSAIEKLVVIDERQTQEAKRVDRMEEQCNKLSEKVMDLQLDRARSDTIGRWLERGVFGLTVLGVYYLANGGTL